MRRWRLSHDWRTLGYNHWLTLFASYNISLYEQYVAIVPQIDLHRVVEHAQVVRHRNRDEMRRQQHNYFVVVGGDVKQAAADNVINSNDSYAKAGGNSGGELSLQTAASGDALVQRLAALLERRAARLRSSDDSTGSSTSNTNTNNNNNSNNRGGIDIGFGYRMRWRVDRLFVYGSLLALVVCLLILCYMHVRGRLVRATRRLSRRRRHRRWSTSSTRRELIMRRHLSAADEDEDDEDEDETVLLSQSDMIRHVVSGRHVEATLGALASFHPSSLSATTTTTTTTATTTATTSPFPIDLIECVRVQSVLLLATCDVRNELSVWSLAGGTGHVRLAHRNVIDQLDCAGEQHATAVWAMCLSADGAFLFVAQSDGRLRAFALLTTNTSHGQETSSWHSGDSGDIGISHLVQVGAKDSSHSSHVLAVARLDGRLELVEFDARCRSFRGSSVHAMRAHRSSLSTLRYVDTFSNATTLQSDVGFLLSLGQTDGSLSVCKVLTRTGELVRVLPSDTTDGQDSDDDESPIRVVCTDGVCVASGSLAGWIRVRQLPMNSSSSSSSSRRMRTLTRWNVFDGDATRPKTTRLIVRMEMSASWLISCVTSCAEREAVAEEEEEIRIWHKKDGRLVTRLALEHQWTSVAAGVERRVATASHGGLFTYYLTRLVSQFRREDEKTSETNSLLLASLGRTPVTPMCLYSRTLLLTGGRACLYLWHIGSGQLVKKINLQVQTQLQVQPTNPFAQIKQIHVVQPNQLQPGVSKEPFVLVVDYSDIVHFVHIPSSFTALGRAAAFQHSSKYK